MQTTRKRTETVSETATIVIVNKPAADIRTGRCAQCDAEVFWIAQNALGLFGISPLLNDGTIHKSGSDFCSRSLIKEIRSGENI
jgi:hypothetical protein